MSTTPASGQSKTHTLSIELPELVVGRLGSTPEQAARHLAELAYIELFRQGEVSSGWAARQLKITKDDFRELLATHDVPYIDMSEEEFLQQLQVAMPTRPLPSKP